MIIETHTPQETFDIGKKLGERAIQGEVYCLSGDLGTGKTVLAQGFADGLGIREPVSTMGDACPCIILMYTGLAISARWMRSAMRTAFTAKGSALSNGRS